MRILYISSVGYPYRCGIGDYTTRLASFISRQKGFGVKILSKTEESSHLYIKLNAWCIKDILSAYNKISDFAPDLVHIQYPGKGLGYFLFLPLLVIFFRFKKMIITLTLHEYEISSLPRRLSSFCLAIISKYIIFTNLREKEKVEQVFSRCGLTYKETVLIGLSANIFNTAMVPKIITNRIRKIATFGLFYPGRKMEDVVKIFSKLAGEDLEFYFIGSYDERQEAYFEKIKEEAITVCGNNKVKFLLNKDEKYLEIFFREMDIFVLLYSDGASFKRTSLITAMSFGIPVVSNFGFSTPSELKDGENILLGMDLDEILKKINELLKHKDLYSRISTNSFRLASNFSWDEIAKKHIEFYSHISDKS